MATVRQLPKIRHKQLNTLLMTKSKRGGKHKDKREQERLKEIQKSLKDSQC